MKAIEFIHQPLFKHTLYRGAPGDTEMDPGRCSHSWEAAGNGVFHILGNCLLDLKRGSDLPQATHLVSDRAGTKTQAPSRAGLIPSHFGRWEED